MRFYVEVKPRRFIAVDGTCVKVNGLNYWVFSVVDVESNEKVCMRVYLSKNMFTAEFFFRRVINLCDGRLEFIVDRAPWLEQVLTRLELNHHHQSFGKRSLAKSDFSSLKQRTRKFNNITLNLKRNKGLRWRRAIKCLNLFCDMFNYYNHLRRRP